MNSRYRFKKICFKIQVAKDLKIVKVISSKFDRYNNNLHSEIKYAIKIQSVFRLTIQKVRTITKFKIQRGLAEKKWKTNQYILSQTWTNSFKTTYGV
jgi:hypothetical protein